MRACPAPRRTRDVSIPLSCLHPEGGRANDTVGSQTTRFSVGEAVKLSRVMTVGAIVIAALSGCATSTAAGPGASPGVGASSTAGAPDVPTAAGTPESVTPTVVGTPTVLALPYGLPDATGFQAAVVFTLSNPSDQPLSEARYDVEFFNSRGDSVGTSDAITVPLAARESRTVVMDETNIEVAGGLSGEAGSNEAALKKGPKTATVTAYASSAGIEPLPSTSSWTSKRTKVNCDTAYVGCAVTG